MARNLGQIPGTSYDISQWSVSKLRQWMEQNLHTIIPQGLQASQMSGETVAVNTELQLSTAALSRLKAKLAIPAATPATQLDYKEFIAPVTVSATTEAAANTAVTGNTITLDGATDVWVEFFCPDAATGAAGVDLFLLLFDGATVIGRGRMVTSSGTGRIPVSVKRRLTAPAAGSHQYIAKAYTFSTAATLNAGAGGSTGTYVPGFLSVTRA